MTSHSLVPPFGTRNPAVAGCDAPAHAAITRPPASGLVPPPPSRAGPPSDPPPPDAVGNPGAAAVVRTGTTSSACPRVLDAELLHLEHLAQIVRTHCEVAAPRYDHLVEEVPSIAFDASSVASAQATPSEVAEAGTTGGSVKKSSSASCVLAASPFVGADGKPVVDGRSLPVDTPIP